MNHCGIPGPKTVKERAAGRGAPGGVLRVGFRKWHCIRMWNSLTQNRTMTSSKGT